MDDAMLNDSEFVKIYLNKTLQRILDLEVRNLELDAKLERSGQLLREARDIINDYKKEKTDVTEKPKGYFDDN
jgi:hypothetical protein